MDVFAVNATVGPEGLCYMLLVLGALQRPARSAPEPTKIHRNVTGQKAMESVEKNQDPRRIIYGLRN